MLAEDDRKPPLGFRERLILAATLGAVASGCMLVGAAGVRPDFPGAAFSWYVQLKFAFAIVLAVTAFFAVVEGAQPDARPWRSVRPILVGPLILFAGVLLELVSTPSSEWIAAGLGTRPELCLIAVPGLSVAPLAAMIMVMRGSAPASPGLAGVSAGLLGGALGAAVYMLRCTDDAPLFVISWYAIAILAMGFVGGWLGRAVLRW